MFFSGGFVYPVFQRNTFFTGNRESQNGRNTQPSDRFRNCLAFFKKKGEFMMKKLAALLLSLLLCVSGLTCPVHAAEPAAVPVSEGTVELTEGSLEQLTEQKKTENGEAPVGTNDNYDDPGYKDESF